MNIFDIKDQPGRIYSLIGLVCVIFGFIDSVLYGFVPGDKKFGTVTVVIGVISIIWVIYSYLYSAALLSIF